MEAEQEYVVVYIGNQLTKHGFNPTTIDTLSPRLREFCKIVCASEKRNVIARLLDMTSTIWRHRRNVRLVLIDTYSSNAFYYALVVSLECILLQKRYVPILHGGGLPGRLVQNGRLCKLIFGRSWLNVSPSLYLKGEFERAGFSVEHIPNFITIRQYPFVERAQLRPKLLYVRAFHAIYNPLLAVQVLEVLVKEFADSSLCMIGPDKDGTFGEVQKFADAVGVSRHLELPGRLEKEEWVRKAEGYDIFINTTNVDNMPVSVVEAMALGLVVISTNVGEIPGIIEHGVNGILVTPGSKEEFLYWIRRLISNPQEARRISASARHKAEQFDWTRMQPKWKKIIED